MATTLFLPSTSAAPAISPTPDAGWTVTSGFDRLVMSPTKASTAMTNKTLLGGTVTAWTIFRQYVYGPLGGVSVPANVSWTLWARASEAAATVNANPRVALRVESAAGVTRGTIATPTTTASGAEFGTTLTSRGFHPTTPTSSGFSIQGGDYLVLEVGVVQSSPTAGNISINFGDDSASNLTTLNVATADNPVLVIDVDLRLFSGGARAFILD